MPQTMNHTPQLTESIRIDIGKMLIAHEMVKLFPDFGDYEKMKTQVNDKWRDVSSIVSIRDFWNLVDSIMMGYKLKNLVRDITSQHYVWSIVSAQSVGELKFSTDINGLVNNTETASEVKAFLEANPTELQRITEGTNEAFPEGNTRHMDPIIVLSQTDGLFVHDGNGRLLKAVVEGQEVISAYVGTQSQAPKSNHWVPTSHLQRLADSKSRDLLIALLGENDNAIFEFQDRVVIENEFKQGVLRGIGL